MPEPSRELSPAFDEMVRLFKAGDTVAAQAIYDSVRAQLGTAVDGVYRAAQEKVAAGRLYEAAGDLADGLELHRLNLAKLPLNVDLAGFYEALAEVYRALGQPIASTVAATLATRGGQSFYAHPTLCQIPILGGLYEQLFGARTDGAFVEIGAFNGETYGNTSGLADLGWRGLYVEPIPYLFEICRQRHAANRNVIVLNAAVGAENGTLAMWQNGQCSTASAEEHAVNLQHGWTTEGDPRMIQVPQFCLDSVLQEAGWSPGFELLVVDVEGFEERVFAGFDVDGWQPRIMIVELIDGDPNFAQAEALTEAAGRVRSLIETKGYEPIYRDLGNTVFRRI